MEATYSSAAVFQKNQLLTFFRVDDRANRFLWNVSNYITDLGTWWHVWLRHCPTSRKVTGLIPNGVIGTFHYLIPLAALWSWGRLSL